MTCVDFLGARFCPAFFASCFRNAEVVVVVVDEEWKVGGGDERQKYGENELAMIFTRIAQRQSSLNNVNGEDDVVKCRTILGSQP